MVKLEMDDGPDQRRTIRLLRLLAGYGAVVWLAVQIVDVLGEHLGWAPIVFRIALLAALMGVPVFLFVVWKRKSNVPMPSTWEAILILLLLLISIQLQRPPESSTLLHFPESCDSQELMITGSRATISLDTRSPQAPDLFIVIELELYSSANHEFEFLNLMQPVPGRSYLEGRPLVRTPEVAIGLKGAPLAVYPGETTVLRMIQLLEEEEYDQLALYLQERPAELDLTHSALLLATDGKLGPGRRLTGDVCSLSLPRLMVREGHTAY